MSLPACKVLTHSDWKKARDKAGGKAGLSKIDMGKALDGFHAALKTQDETKARDASIGLRSAAKVYVAEAAKKYPKVAAVVTEQIAKMVTAFEDALDKDDLAVAPKAVDYDAQMKQGLAMIIQETAKTLALLKPLGDAVSAWLTKKKNTNADPVKQQAVAQELPVLTQRLEQVGAGLGKLRLVGKKLEQLDPAVRNKYKAEYDKAVAQLATQESTIASLRTVLK